MLQCSNAGLTTLTRQSLAHGAGGLCSSANVTSITSGKKAICTCAAPRTNRLSAPASVAVDAGNTMLSQLEYQQVKSVCHGAPSSGADKSADANGSGLFKRPSQSLS